MLTAFGSAGVEPRPGPTSSTGVAAGFPRRVPRRSWNEAHFSVAVGRDKGGAGTCFVGDRRMGWLYG